MDAPESNGIGEWAWRIGAAFVGAIAMFVGFMKALASTARDAKEARDGLPRIAALEVWKAGAEADHRALISRLDELSAGHRAIQELQNEILQRLPRASR